MPKKKRAMTFWHAALYTWDYKDNECVAIDDNFRVISFSWGGGGAKRRSQYFDYNEPEL